MTQEEYEAKVQSMPKELQKTFRESLEISLSKRIVNRFMGVVMQAYAWGQRDAQKVSHDRAYLRGAQDMKDALDKKAVQALADTIGIAKLCEIAEGIRNEKAKESGLPF